MSKAQRDADTSMLPQTVFRTPDSYGYTNSHAYAYRLDGHIADISMVVTMLPSAFFTPAWRGEAS